MARADEALDSQIGYLTKRFSDALNQKDPALMQDVFEPECVVVQQPGQAVKATEQDQSSGGFESLDAHLGGLITADNVALLLVEWTIMAKNADGRLVRNLGKSTDVGRLGPDGKWRGIIDNAFGSGPADAVRAKPGSDSELDNLTGKLTSRFWEAAKRGDLSTARSLFEPKAAIAVQPGVGVRGPQLQAALDKILESNFVEWAIRYTYVADDLAVIIEDWSLNGPPLRGGAPSKQQGTSGHVVRRGEDGQWRYLIHNSFGTYPYRDSSTVL